jgi:membrane-associated HD superfamily phosphohydrolase
MNIPRLTVALFAAAGLCLAGGVSAQTMSKEARDQAIKNAEMQYKTDKAACDGLKGNAKDICTEEAKGKKKVAKAEADAAYENTPKARENARLARADATYEVAKEKCDDLAGNAKDVCVKEAKAAYTKAKANAKVDRVASDTRQEAAQKTASAQREAAEDKNEANYKVAIEKCDSLAGTAKDACVRDAKTRFGKS